jgi:hypothetical protein
MAVALKPTASLYSARSSAEEEEQQLLQQKQQRNYFTTLSPRRRSIRIATQSPTRQTALESDSDSSASSPSRRHSLRVQQKLGFDDLTLLPMNEISTSANDYKAETALSSSQRTRATLNVLPTDLRTPSTSLTPSVNQLALTTQKSNQITPVTRIEDFVTSSELAEMAKTTPLGNFYQPHRHPPVEPMKRAYPLENFSQISQTLAKSYASASASASLSKSTTQPKTPPKQIIQDEFIETASGTVKVVRNLRNRAIVASPFPLTAERRRRSLAGTGKQTAKHSRSFAELLQQALSTQAANLKQAFWTRVHFLKHLLIRHQRNLLVYSIIFVFISASAYHVLDFLTSLNTMSVDSEQGFPSVPPAAPLMPLTAVEPVREQVKDMVSQAQTELQDYLEKRLQDASLFTRDPAGNHHLKPAVYSALTKALPTGGDSATLKEYVDRQLQHLLKQITQKLDARPIVDPVRIEAVFQDLEARINRLEARLTEPKSPKGETPTPQPAQPAKPAVNLFDYAASAQIIPALTTRKLSDSKFQSWRHNDASIVLKSDLSRDAFFSFSGNRGKIAISFANPLRPSHVTIDYPLHLANAEKTCAPRDFELWALPNPRNERDSPRLLGSGTFEIASGQTSQTFALKNAPKLPIRHIQLRIRNNHGNEHFTRFYRLRIHQNNN